MPAGRRDGDNLEHGIPAMSSHGRNDKIGSTGNCNWVGASVEGVESFLHIPSPSRTGKGFHVGQPMDLCSSRVRITRVRAEFLSGYSSCHQL